MQQKEPTSQEQLKVLFDKSGHWSPSEASDTQEKPKGDIPSSLSTKKKRFL